MMLVIDTSTTSLVLGLVDVGDGQPEVIIDRTREVGRAHAEVLGRETQRLFDGSDLLQRIDAVVVGTGPGSYTGLRIGASFALGFGRARGLPVLGVSSFEAAALSMTGAVAVSMDARKGNVYGALYHVSPDQRTVDVIRDVERHEQCVFEDLAQTYERVHDRAPTAQALAVLASNKGRTDWQLSYL